MSKKYDILVFIGRFQPIHNAHLAIIQQAKLLCNKLIIVTGSAEQPRTYKNPFTSQEREHMLLDATRGLLDFKFSIDIEKNIDTIYNDQAWAIRIQSIVNKYTGKLACNIGIIGHKKDESSFYLDMFPQWTFEPVEEIEPLGATDIRDLFFRPSCNMNFIKHVVPQSTYEFLDKFRNTPEWNQVVNERKFIEKYKKQYEHLPYAPIFVTSDAVVICSGHILLIQRKAEPGKGLWAIPGGFVNAKTDKSVRDAAIRELREETGIKVPAPVLIGSIVDSKVFDAIDRSSRGRTITHAFKIVLPDGELPKVKGSDDAEKAKWIPIADIDSNLMFEDHAELISYFVGA